jgi:hypothetical protein
MYEAKYFCNKSVRILKLFRLPSICHKITTIKRKPLNLDLYLCMKRDTKCQQFQCFLELL